MGRRGKIAEQKARLKIPQGYLQGTHITTMQIVKSGNHEQKEVLLDGSVTEGFQLGNQSFSIIVTTSS